MVIDERRDHSIRIPRPDLSIKLGTPNACQQCHGDKSAQWASNAINKWYGHSPSGLQRFAESLHSGAEGAPGAQRALVALALNRGQPSIARATALSLLSAFALAPTDVAVVTGDKDDSPLVRRAAAQALSNSDLRENAEVLGSLLNDHVRAVRIETAQVLAGLPAEGFSAALDRATGEYIAAQELDADRPEAHMNLGLLFRPARQQ